MDIGVYFRVLGAELTLFVSLFLFAILLIIVAIEVYDSVKARLHDKVWKREFLLELARDQAAAAALQQSECDSSETLCSETEQSQPRVDLAEFTGNWELYL